MERYSSVEDFMQDMEEFSEDAVCSDSEKHHIAYILTERDQEKEAREVLESIEDEDYRETCLEVLESWLFRKSFPEGVPIPFAEFVS